jgi:hypothetical protein
LSINITASSLVNSAWAHINVATQCAWAPNITRSNINPLWGESGTSGSGCRLCYAIVRLNAFRIAVQSAWRPTEPVQILITKSLMESDMPHLLICVIIDKCFKSRDARSWTVSGPAAIWPCLSSVLDLPIPISHFIEIENQIRMTTMHILLYCTDCFLNGYSGYLQSRFFFGVLFVWINSVSCGKLNCN